MHMQLAALRNNTRTHMCPTMVLLLIWLSTLQYKQCECSGITSEGTFSYFRAHHTIIGFRNLLGKEKRRQITAALKKAVYFLHLKPITVYSLETWSTLALLTRIIQPQRWQDHWKNQKWTRNFYFHNWYNVINQIWKKNVKKHRSQIVNRQ